ncbi:hypothetical protein [Nocardia terpenica]|uniref:DJ-1/PfpI domain-containing protein n=1 Tax=Nocardia terpenica TaxID=455432 RepID=A0A6G9Z8D6_9NOCA|nr:hypothetical protein [Nocardia terpenica]QIS21617.1 hypothetical protein F6W96_28050 [Nocardia terpenica]
MSVPREALFIVSELGVERDELLVPIERLAAAGIGVTVTSPSGGKIQTYLNDTDRDVVAVDGDRVAVAVSPQPPVGGGADRLAVAGFLWHHSRGHALVAMTA